jgi:extracellular factor (EF) 3-hydroxypalmitic acid methyl ester biosynthesis protein
MHEALSLLVDLTPEDVDRLLDLGQEREVHREDPVIVEGEVPADLFIVLEGVLEVQLQAAGGQVLGRVGPGELVGEVSWLDGEPASAGVIAVEDGVLLVLPRAALASALESEPDFGMRFARGLGRLVAARLRLRTGELAARSTESAVADGLGPWQVLSPAVDQLKVLMQQVEEETRKNDDVIPEAMLAATHDGLDGLCALLTEQIGAGSSTSESTCNDVGALVRRELHPYMLLTRIVNRIYTKPRGYAGDFLTIEWMYRNEVDGHSASGKAIDSAFLERPAAKAVRNRRRLLADEIGEAVEAGGNVMSMACGPAEELFDVFGALDDTSKLKATCLDIDLQALALVGDRRDKTAFKRQMRLEQANLVYMATGRTKLELPPQQLAYSIGLIDYFQDRFVIGLLDWIHGMLAPGGKCILGNFANDNPDRALMDHVLDWKLIHRDEDDMNRLFAASKFGAPCSEIRYEPERVNLFAMGVKA